VKRHAPFLAAPLQQKLRATTHIEVELRATDGETLLVTGGDDQENLVATRWLCARLRALGASAQCVELRSSTPRRAVTWGVSTQNQDVTPPAMLRDASTAVLPAFPAHTALSLAPPDVSRRPAMIDATTFSAGLRALVFSQCHHEDRDLIADVEVAALDASTIEVSGDDVLGVAKFAGLTLSILHVRNAASPVQYITKVTPLERGAAISIRWEAVEN
jgi:hypothetical protein